MVVVALTFLIAALAMVYPFTAAGLTTSDAIFEVVSAVTTTGLTTVTNIHNKPATFLFARAWMQWYGGLGIVALWAALSMGRGNASKALTGIAHDENLVGGTIARSRRVLVVYSIMTLMAFGLLAVCGVPLFAALLHTLAAVSTGGFSSFDNSLAGLPNSSAIAVVVISCLAGAIPMMAYYRVWRRRQGGLFTDRQVWCILVLGVGVTVMLFPLMRTDEAKSSVGVLQDAFTMAFSAQTTAGFSTMDVKELSSAAKAVLIFSMAVGGCAGSTAGGLKLLRLMILLRFVQTMFFRTSLPSHAVSAPRLAGHRLGSDELREASVYVTMWLLVVGSSWFVFLLLAYNPLDSLFEVVSATGTVGLSTGITGSHLPTPLKGVLCADMLMGRLEIVAFIVLFYPRTWIGKRRRSL